ncbi:cation:proton antiporter [Actinomadura graeca]|uniref:Cation:proton antiporter n=1 Tax=Actinomadura graeca TaxID=2750812 RepID=A0ABX8QTC0_9ACTN|nr:cation:proton antiporter [Actinomadura graeca]QXJ21204.1 cation:proton antiporter [Actinomadura graeca]
MTRRFAFILAVLAAGAALGGLTGHVGELLGGPLYLPAMIALQVVGLYGSTQAIDLRAVRRDLGTIVAAVTVGVVVKAALITAVMVALFPHPASLVLGIAMAQIDPLSVAALQRGPRLSRRGRALLLAWASFDDPVTSLLTVYVAALASAASGGSVLGLGGPGSWAADLAANLTLAGVALLIEWTVRRRLRRWPAFLVRCVLLTGVAVIAVAQVWVLAAALAGLVVRPRWPGRPHAVDRFLGRATGAALLLATALLGFILSAGVSPWAGLVLGTAAFGVHAVVSLPLTRRQAPSDRVPMALAQQNGITAIVLALLLEPAFGGTVAIVAPAVLVTNLLHLAANAWHGRSARRPDVSAVPRGGRFERDADLVPEVVQ